MRVLPIRVLFAAKLTLLVLGIGAGSAVHARDGELYQIVKATDSRVWRLNTQTGEIAVCSLTGEHLLCTSSAQAMTPPSKRYADLEAERDAQTQLDAQQREERRQRSLEIVNLMMGTFKQLATLGIADGEAN